MSRNENRNYGNKIEYDPQWKGPLEIERQPTDVGFLIAYGISFALWMAIGIYAFCTAEKIAIHDTDPEIETHVENYLTIIRSSLPAIIFVSLAFSLHGFVLCGMYLVSLRYFPKQVVCVAIFVLCLSLLVSMIIYTEFLAHKVGNSYENMGFIAICAILLVTIIVCTIVYRRKIAIACRVIQESTKALMFFPSSFLFLIVPFTLIDISFAFFISIAVCLMLNPSMHSDDAPIHLYFFHAYNFFEIVWTMGFICAFSQMVLTGTHATWYWSMDKDRIPNNVVLKFMRIVTKYHLGSLAFGSLILTIIEGIGSISRNQHASATGTNAYTSSSYLADAAHSIFEYLNHNAYAMCIMHGTKFIQSAKDAFYLLVRNLMKVLILKNVADAVVCLGVIICVFFPTMGAFFYCQNMELSVMITIILIVFISTDIIAAVVFKVLSTAIDTIFICVLEDCERNDGSSGRPYFMPPTLKEVLIKDGYINV